MKPAMRICARRSVRAVTLRGRGSGVAGHGMRGGSRPCPARPVAVERSRERPPCPPTFRTVALVQMDVRAGRPDLNVRSMLEYIERARKAGAAIVAFPEMCIPGYILGDTWEIDALVEDYESWSTAIRDASRGIAVLFGNVAIDRGAIGEDGRVRKLNAAWVCHDGRFVERAGLPAPLPHGVHPKTLHPNYRFFDDGPALLLAAQDRRGDRHRHPRLDGPLRQLRPNAVSCGSASRSAKTSGTRTTAIATSRSTRCTPGIEPAPISSSTCRHRRGRGRRTTSATAWCARRWRRSPVPFFYVNQVGAQNNGKNILVFDGDTCGYRTDGTIAGRASPWREAMLVLDGGSAAGEGAACGSPGSGAVPRPIGNGTPRIEWRSAPPRRRSRRFTMRS